MAGFKCETSGAATGGGTSPVAASTLATTIDTTSPYAFAPTLSLDSGTAGGTWNTVITRTSDASSVTVTDPTTTTPTATLTAASAGAGDSFLCVSTYTDPDSLTDSVETAVGMAGTGAGSWATQGTGLDFTADVTNIASLTEGAENTVYLADGTTEKATVRFDERIVGAVGIADVTSGTGLTLGSHGNTSNKASSVAVKFDSASVNAWEDPGFDMAAVHIVAVDLLYSGLKYDVANGDLLQLGICDTDDYSSVNNNFGIYLHRASGTDYEEYWRRTLGGAAGEVGEVNAETTQGTTVAVRILIFNGHSAIVFWEMGATAFLEGIPTVAGSLYSAVLYGYAAAVDASKPIPNAFWIVSEVLSNGSSTTDRTLTLEKIRFQVFE